MGLFEPPRCMGNHLCQPTCHETDHTLNAHAYLEPTPCQSQSHPRGGSVAWSMDYSSMLARLMFSSLQQRWIQLKLVNDAIHD